MNISELLAQRMGRGKFVSLAVGTVLFGCRPNDQLAVAPKPAGRVAPESKSTPTDEIKKLSIEIEQDFGISLEPAWDEKRLNLLKKTLSLLPSELYKISTDRRLTFSLNTTPAIRGKSFSSISKEGVIELSKDFFGTGNPDDEIISFEDLTSLLVLSYISKDRDGKILGSGWKEKVENVLGEEFVETSGRLAYEAYDKGRGIKSDSRHASEDRQFFNEVYQAMDPDSRFIITAETPAHFLPILAIHYIRGKDYFVSQYSKLFAPDKANALYELVKEDIFQKREYK